MRITCIALLCVVALSAAAQDCPKENSNGPPIDSAPRTLTGKVVYHDGLRQWFGLQLAKPVCGVTEIQLFKAKEQDNANAIAPFRGCRITAHGPLGIPMTGYYSAEIYQDADTITSASDCIRQPLFPDYSNVKPEPSVRNYRVSMRIDYAGAGGHIAITARSDKHTLTPWQAYASYWLTGGYSFYAFCADDFHVKHFTGTPAAKPWLIDNQIAMDPESAAAKHVTHIRLDYTCRRSKE